MTRPYAIFLALAITLSTSAAPPVRAEVVAVVSARSSVGALSPAQVADIFLGKTSRFPDGSQAVPIDQTEDSPVRDRFYSRFTGKSPAQVKAHWSKIIFTGRGQPPRQAASGMEARKLIADNPNAIGYIDSNLIDPSVKVLAAP